jgi:isoleucyl-tRNA synthetase
MHYPFENRERFEANFSADFMPRTRSDPGWFLYADCSGVISFQYACVQEVIVNGIYLARTAKAFQRLRNTLLLRKS